MALAMLASSPRLDDPMFQSLVNTATNTLKLGILQGILNAAAPAHYVLKPDQGELAVGGKIKKKYHTAGFVAANRFKNFPPDKRTLIINELGSPHIYDNRLRQFATSANVRLEAEIYALNQINHKTEFRFKIDSFEDPIVNRFYSSLCQVGVPTLGLIAGSVVINKGVKLYLNSVKCIDETDPEWPGNDEIACGGTTLDDKGSEASITEFKVRDGFKDGMEKSFDPPRILQNFSLEGDDYPKTFSAFLGLAEKDSGGFSSFLSELYEAIKAELQKILDALGDAAGAYLGAALGGSVGTAVGGPIGAIIGVVAGLILGELIAWLIDVFKDDIFTPQMATLTLPTSDATFSGGTLTSPILNLVYEDFGGKYNLFYSWEITR